MTYGVSADQMLFLSDVLDAMKKDEEGFRLLSKHCTFVYGHPDYSLSMEWAFDNMRIAIDIESDLKESGWSLSSTREAGNHSTGGYLTKESIESAVSLIYFILKEQKDNLDREVTNGQENV